MKILITRPEQDALKLSSLLKDRGAHPVLCPLIKIAPIPFQITAPQSYQAVLVTSSNSIMCLKEDAQLDRLIDIPLYAVGDASMRAAHDAGFKTVSSAEGDMEALRRLIESRLHPEKGPLLYLSGEVISGDLKGLLETSGYTVERVVLYSATPLEKLPDEVRTGLETGEISGVVFYSRRTARIFFNLIKKSGAVLAAGVEFFCLSQAVAQVIRQNIPDSDPPLRAKIETSDRPDQAALLELMSKKIS